MSNTRDCPHGRQIGKCSDCDLAELYEVATELDMAKATISRLEAENERLKRGVALLQQHNAEAWNNGHRAGLRANETSAKQALEAVQKDAWGNTQLTEALMAAEAENEALRATRAGLAAALKSTGLFLQHIWRDVQMNDYSYGRLNQQIEVVDAALAKAGESE